MYNIVGLHKERLGASLEAQPSQLNGRDSLRSRRYSRARENGKLEIPPAQKLHILSSPAAGCRSILIGQNVDFEFVIDRSKELE